MQVCMCTDSFLVNIHYIIKLERVLQRLHVTKKITGRSGLGKYIDSPSILHALHSVLLEINMRTISHIDLLHNLVSNIGAGRGGGLLY